MENTTQSATPAPTSGGGWKTMGILSIVFGGLVILFSFIPCLGAYAMYLAVVPIILSVVALTMANSAKAPKTMAIIGLAVSLGAVGIGYMQYSKLKEVGSKLEKLGSDLKDSLKKDSLIQK